MLRYEFAVDKNACFTYWAQSLVKWGWYFEQREYELYQKTATPLTSEERRALEQLKTLLTKEGNHFLWLWKKYDGLSVGNTQENEQWESIQSTLWPRFEELWKTELPLLEGWRERLKSFSFSSLTSPFQEVVRFFDAQFAIDPPRTVKLLFHFNPDTVAGHGKKEFPNLLILNVSHARPEIENRVINVLLHETMHLVEYQSSLTTSLLQKSYQSVIEPHAIKLAGYKWKHLLTETIISSIASMRLNNYFGRIIEKNPKAIADDVVNGFDLDRNKTNYEFLIRVLAGRIEELTAHYLREKKKIDKTFTDSVAHEWVQLFAVQSA